MEDRARGGNGICWRCLGKVANNGNEHGKGKCSKRGIFGDHRRRKKNAKKNRQGAPQRGAPVAGLARKRGSSKKGAKNSEKK